MKKFIKENFAVILAFVLPVVLILVVGSSVYLPSLFVNTDYNFVYVSCSDGMNNNRYYCNNHLNNLYTTKDNRMVKNIISPSVDSDNDGIPDIEEDYTVRIFLHNTKKNETREIPFKEAETLTLNSLLTSPDGVIVSGIYDRNSEFISLFGSSSSYGYYLTKGNSKRKINLINQNNNRYYYQNNFKFIGWVLPSRN
ncbi:MAG: hypothetical protein KAS32_08770 [Candidatus Peribacteraceae bacterium]|nr:hypothetical protein [Candidatus Peribacteraceae bacterium]